MTIIAVRHRENCVWNTNILNSQVEIRLVFPMTFEENCDPGDFSRNYKKWPKFNADHSFFQARGT